ncbi:MAG: pyruvate dehydrogenase (acetyl-transferring) E1 component subunit alpha [Acidimicrobiia bacterium]|nr:pyruvate dehydrogenase (acetyl-transferring) E1 component subunit alpha [Acidimicrobiia bacterium]
MDQILTPEGELLRDPPIRDDLIVRLYRAMVFARQYDHKSVSLQRQGRLATYAPFEGQEAAQIGAAAALHPDDWLVATYRDAAAMWAHGYPMDLLYLGRTGDERGGAPPEDVPCLPPSITVGGHMIHAVGIAWAEKLKGARKVALTMFGDGATSEGDFHEAMNFAAVYETPTVFLCQNNGYAISMPVHEQMRAERISDKAVGYGMPGETVDGNDLLVVYERVLAAVNRARSGGGPTLIEAVTYRMGPHTTNDDPGRYRTPDEEAEAKAKDPLERVRRYLESKDQWSEDWEAEVRAEAASAADEAIAAAESVPKPTADDLFGAVFAEQPPHIAEQRGWIPHE